MAYNIEDTRESLLNAKDDIFTLIQQLLDNNITAGQATSTALKAKVDAVNTAVQAATGFYNLD